jgi:hypothetical protein
MQTQRRNTMTKKAEIGLATQHRIDACAAGKDHAALVAAMTIENPIKRGDALYEAGYCSDGYGLCRADDGKVAKRWTNEAGKLVTMCAHHTKLARKLNGTKAPKKVTEIPAPKAAAPLKEQLRKAAGPTGARKASEDVGEVTAYMQKHRVSYSKASAAVKAARKA